MSFVRKEATVDHDAKWIKQVLNYEYHVSFHVWDLGRGEMGEQGDC